jgi:hypothetical protein
MHVYIDMASSPQYLAQSAHNQVDTNTVSLPDVSCPHGQPSTVAYQDPNQDSYAAVSNTYINLPSDCCFSVPSAYV